MNLMTSSTINILGIEKKTSFISDDRIFLGEGLFETIRVDQKRPCYPALHLQRMQQAAISLGIPFELSRDVWYEHLIRCIEASNINAGGVKVILSGGRARRGLDARGNTPSLMFDAFLYSPHRQALRLVSAGWLRDATNPIYQLKSVNYLESILARRQALAGGADDAVFFNLEHHVTETTIANLFLVKNDQLFTPMLANGVLAGITRSRLINLSMSAGINCAEISINRSMLREADALFVTNALQGIQSVRSFDGGRLPTRHHLVSLLRELLATDEVRWD